MLDHAIGPNVIRDLTTGMAGFLDRNAERGWTSLADFRGLRRGAVVPHARIGRPVRADYQRGFDEMPEGYAAPEAATEPVTG